ncbi:MAG: hypothetical protein ACLFM3_08375 [Desulfohalobiaceae bacterium]
MSNNWLQNKQDEIVTDILKNFCYVQQTLEQQFQEYKYSGYLDFQLLSDLVGHDMNQGRLWRLKDTAHLLFRYLPDPCLSGRFLDWSLGYIFHECMKLKEDAYQQQNYAAWFSQLEQDPSRSSQEREISKNLYQLVSQTKESIRREVNRISYILNICRKIFIQYLPLHQDNALLARFIYTQNHLMRSTFRSAYPKLILAIYGQQQEMLYCLAARSLRQGGWSSSAADALQQALKINPKNPDVKQEKELLQRTQPPGSG